MLRSFPGISLALVLFHTLPAGAHHSFSKYDSSKHVQASGVVSTVRYQNPHVFFTLVSDTGTWSVETESLPILQRGGITESVLKDGAKATVSGWKAKDGSATIGLRAITIGGKSVTLRRSVR